MSPLSQVLKHVNLGVCIPGVVLSVLLLGAVAYLQWNPASRPHLNRVSFRLLLYALIANIIFACITIIPKHRGHFCSVSSFLGATSLMFSSCMFCCMAINLPFVLVYGLNGNKLEKYYILGSLFLVGACNIPAWATGALGWYRTGHICWLRGPDEGQLHWLIGTRTVWVVIMALLEVLSFVQILVFMVRTQLRIHRLRADTGSKNPAQGVSGVGTLRSSLPKSPIVRYRSMIIRIGLYPLLSCFLTTTSCIADVYVITHAETTRTHYYKSIALLNMNMYSLRPLLYVLLAAVDPSLLRAVRALRPTAPSESLRTAHLHPWDVSVSTLANTVSSTEPHTMPVLPHDPAGADAASAVDEEKQTGTEDEDEVQAASIARQI